MLRGSAAGVNGDTIQLFVGADVIDITDLRFATARLLAYQGTASSGTLTNTDGVRTATTNLIGNYTAGNFHLDTDANGGSLISFVSH